MSYCTQQQLIDRFGEEELIQHTDRLNSGAIDTAVLDAAIADASATADSYLQQVRALPLSQAVIDASPLARYCGDIVLFYLYSNGGPEYVEKAHDKAITWLRDIVTGKASLGAEDEPAAADSNSRITTAQGVSKTDWSTY